jgi:hypothetical protein
VRDANMNLFLYFFSLVQTSLLQCYDKSLISTEYPAFARLAYKYVILSLSVRNPHSHTNYLSCVTMRVCVFVNN